MGGLEGSPKPPALGRAPAVAVARLDTAARPRGPRRAPQAPALGRAPAVAVARLDTAARPRGPRRAPQAPRARTRPGSSRGAPRHGGATSGASKGPPSPFEGPEA